MTSDAFLMDLGRQLKALRQRRGLSQEQLARLAGLSPRYLSQIEGGRGNVSIVRLRELSEALRLPLPELLQFETRPERCHPLVALLGLRGAGKSSVGRLLADRLSRDFFELDALIEDEAGLGLEEIFALHGESYYRRLEREVLSRFVAGEPAAVLATGGGLVTDRVTYDLLESSAVTVWLRARPERHLERVAAQGDPRPMAGHADPLAELRALLRERDPLYGEADITIDTSDLRVDAVVDTLVSKLRDAGLSSPAG